MGVRSSWVKLLAEGFEIPVVFPDTGDQGFKAPGEVPQFVLAAGPGQPAGQGIAVLVSNPGGRRQAPDPQRQPQRESEQYRPRREAGTEREPEQTGQRLIAEGQDRPGILFGHDATHDLSLAGDRDRNRKQSPVFEIGPVPGLAGPAGQRSLDVGPVQAAGRL